MTVGELIRKLERERSTSEVVFDTKHSCPMGYPEWEDASVRADEEHPGIVRVSLTRLKEDGR